MKDISYHNYLQLDSLLGAQRMRSEQLGEAIHDEMLFIITHQAYELWFKQINHELKSVSGLMSQQHLHERDLTCIVSRCRRVVLILKHLVEQITLLESMTPMDFLDFRDYLGTSSGFQSRQFRELEMRMGRHDLLDSGLLKQLPKKDLNQLLNLAKQPSLFAEVNRWLENMPFLEFKDFNFWSVYRQATEDMLTHELSLLEQSHFLSPREKQAQRLKLQQTGMAFASFINEESFEEANEQWGFKLSQQALLAALFIFLYRHEPILYIPYTFLNLLQDMDEQMTLWRQRHVSMVQRMLGSKVGTGGTSGHVYLRQMVERGQVFHDLNNLASFLIPRSALPQLPKEMEQALGFHFSPTKQKSAVA